MMKEKGEYDFIKQVGAICYTFSAQSFEEGRIAREDICLSTQQVRHRVLTCDFLICDPGCSIPCLAKHINNRRELIPGLFALLLSVEGQ